jgi:hypothetical protein
MGYTDNDIERPTIDWKSSQRKTIEELSFRNYWGNKLSRKPDYSGKDFTI